MPRTCKVCGSGDISIFWSLRWNSNGYCSYRCYAVGTADYVFAAATFFGIFAIFLIFFALVIPNPALRLLGYGIATGVVAIICSFQCAIGFYFKRKDKY
ncbi:MAG: hypothetical protein H7647_00615 [Candidatus Heimdallarchaeota archaeon]|jgi:hypothetical protein|nr:hypothetical protein [Candidatus Heimdallarchaeota archaeon]MCK4252936.1 hypothetical protein [Candidatus Heimdallarchaeota archaeon]